MYVIFVIMGLLIPFSISCQQVDKQFIDPNSAILDINKLVQDKHIDAQQAETLLIKLLSQKPTRAMRFERFASPEVKKIIQGSTTIQNLKTQCMQTPEYRAFVEHKLTHCGHQLLRLDS